MEHPSLAKSMGNNTLSEYYDLAERFYNQKKKSLKINGAKGQPVRAAVIGLLQISWFSELPRFPIIKQYFYWLFILLAVSPQ
jgi:hypothetical protein